MGTGTLQLRLSAGSELSTFNLAPEIWILATVAAMVIIILLYSKIRDAIGAMAEPQINGHNVSQTAHATMFGELRTAVAVLNTSIISLQKQIDTNEATRRESLEAVQAQLRFVIDLLEHEAGSGGTA